MKIQQKINHIYPIFFHDGTSWIKKPKYPYKHDDFTPLSRVLNVATELKLTSKYIEINGDKSFLKYRIYVNLKNISLIKEFIKDKE